MTVAIVADTAMILEAMAVCMSRGLQSMGRLARAVLLPPTGAYEAIRTE